VSVRDPDPLYALDCSYLDAQRVFMGVSATGEYVERKDVAIVCCGLPARELNFGFLKPPSPDPKATASAVGSYFRARKLPYRLLFRRAHQGPELRELESIGWRNRDDPTPGMTRALPASTPTAPAGLMVQEVRTVELLVGFRETAFRGFGYPVAAARLFLNERLLALPQVRLYAGIVHGTVVATSLLVASGPVAGIYWVATLEDERGRGYGEALTWAAVGGGQELGCRIASLQASKAGRRVYERMGFDHVLDYESLSPPES
jgi:GNAT superfamily N-acetyltransferase